MPSQRLRPSARYAFVDVETTGLNPAENRIAEIGVVTSESAGAQSWTTFVRVPPAGSDYIRPDHPGADAPPFRDIADDLRRRLADRVLVAHNARFDFSFLKAEFARAGIVYDAPALCTVMLSRSLYPAHAKHDLDSLAERHGLPVSVRHRALPDAELLWQWWQAIHRELDNAAIGSAVENLLAAPPLPPGLEPSLLSRLPESPGAYLVHGHQGRPLLVSAATNLRLAIIDYFRIDQATARARAYADEVSDISWRATRGPVGAQLHALLLKDAWLAGPNAAPAAFTWQFRPDHVPCLSILPFDACQEGGIETFGAFASERKARNALERLAVRNRLCHSLIGVTEKANLHCAACPVDQPTSGCVDLLARKRQLLRLVPAIAPLRVPAWPYSGAIGIRERGELHVVDNWQFLGTIGRDCDLHDVLGTRRKPFDPRQHRLIQRILRRMPTERVVDLDLHARIAHATDAPAGRSH